MRADQQPNRSIRMRVQRRLHGSVLRPHASPMRFQAVRERYM